MDFTKLADEAKDDDTPVEVAIKDRRGEPYTGKDGQPTVLLVIGEYSPQYRKADQRINDRIVKQARRGADFDGEDAEQVGAEKLAGAVVGWRNVEDGKGVAVPFTPKNVVRLLREAPWVVPQVQRAHKAHADFFAPDSAS